jgi:cell division protein FtsW
MTMTWLDDGCPLRDDPAPVGDVRRRRSPDPIVTLVVAILALGGLAVSGSARVYEDALAAGSPEGLLKSSAHLALGLTMMLALLLPHYALLTRRLTLWAILAGSVLLLLLPFAGPEIHGTHRWIRVHGLSLQPSELIKPVLVLIVAASLVRAGEELREWSGLMRPLLLAGLLTALVLAGKDLGTPVLLATTTLAMAFVAGARLRHLAGLALAGVPLFLFFARLEPYRWERLTNFTRALGRSGAAFDEVTGQLRQSLIAIGSGGITGKGFGSSTQKAFFLPERDTDFVFAIIAEELGLIGAMAVLALFLILGWRGVTVARGARDRLGMLIATGATCLLCTQALCHAGVVSGLLPTKGLPLPFLSTGGSSLIASFALVGLLLNVSLRRRARGT